MSSDVHRRGAKPHASSLATSKITPRGYRDLETETTCCGTCHPWVPDSNLIVVNGNAASRTMMTIAVTIVAAWNRTFPWLVAPNILAWRLAHFDLCSMAVMVWSADSRNTETTARTGKTRTIPSKPTAAGSNRAADQILEGTTTPQALHLLHRQCSPPVSSPLAARSRRFRLIPVAGHLCYIPISRPPKRTNCWRRLRRK